MKTVTGCHYRIWIVILSMIGNQWCFGTTRPIWMNIFIHGTIGVQSTASFKNFFLLLRDAIIGTEYEHCIAAIRQNPRTFLIQPIQDLGLKPIHLAEPYANASQLFAGIFNTIDYATSRNKQKTNLYYTFGWSGVLSYRQRLHEARLLYRSLRSELEKLAQQNIFPKIRIIGYSHGGSIALNLGAIRQQDFSHDSFSIAELILLGMPVQRASTNLIWSPVFKKIYHIYSAGDRIQRADLFNPANMFSHKRFCEPCPQNLTQIELKLTAQLLPSGTTFLPSRWQRAVNQSPGHIELWFFGWTSSHYRQNLAIYPLPMGIFIPYITKVTNAYVTGAQHITLDIRPNTACTILKPREYKSTCPRHICHTAPFFNPCSLSKLQNAALSFMAQHEPSLIYAKTQ